ncbi:MAG: glycogen debranching protein GlgX [Pseudolabrys sp.]|nr:glycogen debranching protein GlgX [Pseudolabrys sp.]
MLGTLGTCRQLSRVKARSSVLSSHRLLPSFSFLRSNGHVTGGSPHPLGATWDGRGTNFALFSAHATKVELCLFDGGGRHESERIALPERTDDVWHGYLSHVRPGQIYGYRVHGPYEPQAGHRFNANKLLLDPYAKDLAGELTWNDSHFAYRTGNKQEDLSFDKRDNARFMVKAVVTEDAHSWSSGGRLRTPWEETFFYEAHVKGLTIQHPGVDEKLRGSYAALTQPAIIKHLRNLGVTAIELLPVHTFVDDRYLVDKGLKNYWGYNTLNFFTPARRYARSEAISEFRAMVAGLHDAGIEVILDVVYNHTAEGNHLGPTLSYRGIDNASYYWLTPDSARFYENYTGTGNALKLSHPRVLQMVMDSLRRWVEVYHVDGFRFDLASTLGRTPEFNRESAFFAAIRQDPVLADVKLIAEPWDIGLGGYQVGGFPNGWSEWNDIYRKAMRRYWRGEPKLLGEVAGCITGSALQFQHDGRGPRASVNHVTVHDGFTLQDLVSYEHKHNEKNGEDNRDGSDDNASTNCGVEGPSDDPAIRKLRRQLRKNQLACLLLAQGVPLMLAGDEVANSQDGNNNAYCQDNETGWVSWDGADGEDDVTTFVGEVAALRRKFPQLRPHQWLQGKNSDGAYDVKWLTPAAGEMGEGDWNFEEGRFLSYVLAPIDEGGRPLYIVLNAAQEGVEFTLPEWPLVAHWINVLDTAENGDHVQGGGPNEKRSARPLTVIAFAGEP